MGAEKSLGERHSSARERLRDVLLFILAAAFVCTGFSATASWGLLASTAIRGAEPTFSSSKLVVKAVVFSILFGASIWFFLRHNRFSQPPPVPPIQESASPALRGKLIVLLVSVALLASLRLAKYPHIEPDETHHLIVARNLATHGVYGSGMPATGFRWFDDYDSVGPTVIVPVALVMRATGKRIEAGRLVLAAFYLLVTLLVYKLLAITFGSERAIWGAFLLIAAPGSIYLARSLYGEVPALAFLFAGALAWRHALSSPRPLAWNVATGLLFGCALVTKYFLVVAVWAAIAVWCIDRLTHRSIRLAHAVVPAIVALLVLATWLAITSIFGPHGTDTPSAHVSQYQHYLLFGVGSLGKTSAWLLQNAVPGTVFLLIGVAAVGTLSLRARYSPPLLFLTLFAVLNAFWWIFFTTGSHPRYLWYSLAIGAACFGATVPAFRLPRPAPHLTMKLAVAALALWGTVPHINAVLRADEMQNDYALLHHLNVHFPDGEVGTTQYTIERLINLSLERPATRVRTSQNVAKLDAIIIDSRLDSENWPAFVPTASYGPYLFLEPLP